MEMGIVCTIIMLLCSYVTTASIIQNETLRTNNNNNAQQQRRVSIDVRGGPESVVWIVQLSDLHFSVHHPKRALDFKTHVGPTLAMINPSLVLITGDLTDAKSKDMVEARQDEMEWVEYQNVMEDVIEKSGLDKSIFYDLRGNHDNYGVPVVGGSFDFFPKYSINGQLGRTGTVNSVTLQIGEHKHLFVGFDSTLSVGVRGPTNIFGHPMDQLLSELDSELSQWDFQSIRPVTKISFGHFPLSFSVNSESGKSLKDTFLKHSVSAYLCGHLHRSFGKNLKRHHQLGPHSTFSEGLFQLNAHQLPSTSTRPCSNKSQPINEFWEWEMGDWRSSRSIRILVVDKGHVSFVDMDLQSGAKKIIILPTFPLDSRFMLTMSSLHKYKCGSTNPLSYETIRALVFSVSPITSVVSRIYDSRHKKLDLVMEVSMRKLEENSSRGDLYTAPWNFKAFEDQSPDRYWLQIEAIDLMGRTSLTELRPFSVNGISAKFSWTWKEFKVMGCQLGALYYPFFWSTIMLMVYSLLISKALQSFSKKQFTYLNFSSNRGIVNLIAWGLTQFFKDSFLWFGMLGYLFYLILFPWFHGQIFTAGGERAYMTYRGWVMKNSNGGKKIEFIAFPDVMVVVIPHLFVVVLPAILSIGALACEADKYRSYLLSSSIKKKDDQVESYENHRRSYNLDKRWIRTVLLLACFAIIMMHLMKCIALMKAYQMNPVLHFQVYSISIPLLLAYAVYSTRTRRIEQVHH